MTWPLHPGSGRPALRFGVVGWPVAHSLSPAMHRAALAAVGSPHSYDAVPVEPRDLDAFLERLRERGGAVGAETWGGVNVTIPHKEAAARAADRLSPAASALGAANVLLVEQDAGRGASLLADNTDAAALLACLRELPNEPSASGPAPAQGRRPDRRPGRACAPASALVLGAGGAARAALWALAHRGARHVRVGARSLSRARAMADDLVRRWPAAAPTAAPTAEAADDLAAAPAAASPTTPAPASLPAIEIVDLADEASLASALREADVVINATPVGLADPGHSPLADALWTGCPPGGHVLDLVYGPCRRRLQVQAESHGWTYADGLDMLVRQAAQSWLAWFGEPGPEGVMRAAAEAALRAAT